MGLRVHTSLPGKKLIAAKLLPLPPQTDSVAFIVGVINGVFKDIFQLLSGLSFQMFFAQEAERVHDWISLKVDANISVTCF